MNYLPPPPPEGDSAPETVLVLPGGIVHVPGLPLMQVTGSPTQVMSYVWRRGRDGAQRYGGPVVMRVALPSGRIDARTVTAGGTTPHRPAPHTILTNPLWNRPLIDADSLLGAARGAERRGDIGAAEVTAGRYAATLHARFGVHPHSVRALEYQARLAADARRWAPAARLYTTAARGRHWLASPGDAETANARHAVAAWLRATGPDTADAGFTLAHTLTGQCPPPPALLAALLRRLAEPLTLPITQEITR